MWVTGHDLGGLVSVMLDIKACCQHRSVFEPALFLAELDSRRQSNAGLQSDARDKIAAEERKLEEVTRQESELVNLRLQGVVSQEALVLQRRC